MAKRDCDRKGYIRGTVINRQLFKQINRWN